MVLDADPDPVLLVLIGRLVGKADDEFVFTDFAVLVRGSDTGDDNGGKYGKQDEKACNARHNVRSMSFN